MSQADVNLAATQRQTGRLIAAVLMGRAALSCGPSFSAFGAYL
jgi:hypothetical protein